MKENQPFSFRKIAVLSSIYGIAPVVDKVLSFVFLPIFTHYLVPEEYGSLVLLYVYGALIQLLLYQGIPAAILKIYWDYSEGERKRFIGSIWLYVLLCNLAVFLPMTVFAKTISSVILKNDKILLFYVLILLKCLIISQTSVPGALIRIKEKKGLILLSNFTSIIVRFGLTAILLIPFKMNLMGVFIADLCASFLNMLVCLPALFGEISISFQLHYIKSVFSLSLYQLGLEFMGWIVSISDRPIIQQLLHNTTEIGIYSVGYTFGSAIMFIILPFKLAWLPHIYSVFARDEQEYREQMVYFFKYYSAICMFSFFFIGLLSPDAVRILTPEIYHKAGSLVSIVAAGVMMASISDYFMSTFFVSHKMHVPLIIYLMSSLTNVGLNILLIPKVGIIGAAYSTLAAYSIMAVVQYVIAQKLIKLEIHFGAQFAAIALVSVSLLFFNAIKVANPYLSLLIKTVVAAFVLAISAGIYLHKRNQSKVKA